ncbi:hypothetical protein GNI_097090, partial [Gregarina niphandrodes]
MASMERYQREYNHREAERYEREREARRLRFAKPLFDFAPAAVKQEIAAEKLARERKSQQRANRVREFLENSEVVVVPGPGQTEEEEGILADRGTDPPRVALPPVAPDGSLDLYEAMYVTKGARLTPEDYAPSTPVNESGRQALNAIS